MWSMIADLYNSTLARFHIATIPPKSAAVAGAMSSVAIVKRFYIECAPQALDLTINSEKKLLFAYRF